MDTFQIPFSEIYHDIFTSTKSSSFDIKYKIVTNTGSYSKYNHIWDMFNVFYSLLNIILILITSQTYFRMNTPFCLILTHCSLVTPLNWAQKMACYLLAPSHYLKQYWLIIKGVLSLPSGCIFTWNAHELNMEPVFKIFTTSPRGQWVKLWIIHNLCNSFTVAKLPPMIFIIMLLAIQDKMVTCTNTHSVRIKNALMFESRHKHLLQSDVFITNTLLKSLSHFHGAFNVPDPFTESCFFCAPLS